METLVAIVKPLGTPAQNAFRLPQNAHRLKRSEEPHDANSNAMGEGDTTALNKDTSSDIHLSTTQHPRDLSKGFIFGSDPDFCDVLLAKNKRSGISGTHFAIHIDWESKVTILVCLSLNGVRIESSNTGNEGEKLERDMWIRILQGVSITVGVNRNLSLILICPERKTQHTLYEQNLEMYFEDCKKAVPQMANFNLGDLDKTPFLVNRGKGTNGRIYLTTDPIVIGFNVVTYQAKSLDSLITQPRLHLPGEPFPDLYFSRPNYLSSQPSAIAPPSVQPPTLPTPHHASSSIKTQSNRPTEVYTVRYFRVSKKPWKSFALGTVLARRHLHHRHIIRVLDVITDTVDCMLVLEQIPRLCLATAYKDDSLTTESVGTILGQIFEALEYLHKNNVCHGALNPHNILVESEDPPKIMLTDIGIYTHVELEGSPSLYASQKKLDSAGYEPEYDIWSAGVVGFELLHPEGLPERKAAHRHQWAWVRKLLSTVLISFRYSVNEGKKFVKGLLQHVEIEKRPTAQQCLQNQWIQNTKVFFTQDSSGDGPIRSPSLGDSSDLTWRPSFIDPQEVAGPTSSEYFSQASSDTSEDILKYLHQEEECDSDETIGEAAPPVATKKGSRAAKVLKETGGGRNTAGGETKTAKGGRKAAGGETKVKQGRGRPRKDESRRR